MKYPQVDDDKLLTLRRKSKNTELAIVDPRVCQREELADSVRTSLDTKVLTCDSIKLLLQTPFKAMPSTDQVIVICDGAASLQDTLTQLQTLRNEFPQAKRVLLTDNASLLAYADVEELELAGVIPSFYNTEQFFICLRAIVAGLQFIPPSIATRVSTGPQETPDAVADILTPRQLQIMNFIATGKTNKHIAEALSLRESTVKVHVHDVMKRLGAKSRTHATHIINELRNQRSLVT